MGNDADISDIVKQRQEIKDNRKLVYVNAFWLPCKIVMSPVSLLRRLILYWNRKFLAYTFLKFRFRS